MTETKNSEAHGISLFSTCCDYKKNANFSCLSEQKTEKYILIFHVSDHPPDCKLIGTSHFVRRPVTK